MKRRRVALSSEAEKDLAGILQTVASATSREVAISYLDRIETFLAGFDIASKLGTLRDDIRLGLRIVGFERRLTIAFTVTELDVIILRVFGGGMDWQSELEPDET